VNSANEFFEGILQTGRDYDCVLAGCTELPLAIDLLRLRGSPAVTAFLSHVRIVDPLEEALRPGLIRRASSQCRLLLEKTVGASRFPNSDVEQSVPARFERQARTYPDRIAIEGPATALTYRELNQLANRIAHAVLSVSGKGPEAVCAAAWKWRPRCGSHAGVLKSGKVHVALDAAQPAARAEAIVAEARPSLLIADRPRMEQAKALCAVAGLSARGFAELRRPGAGLSDGNPDLAISGGRSGLHALHFGLTGRPRARCTTIATCST